MTENTMDIKELQRRGLDEYSPLKEARARLADVQARFAAQRVELERRARATAKAAELLTNAEIAAVLGQETDYKTVRQSHEQAQGELWEAQRQMKVLEVAIQRQHEEVTRQIEAAEREVGTAVREQLHSPAVRRIARLLRELSAAAEEEEQVREALTAAFATASPNDTSARDRAVRYIRPLGMPIAGRLRDPYSRVRLYEKEAKENGYVVD